MTSLQVSGKHEPLSMSEPSSPMEEDLAKASAWDDDTTSTLVPQKWKGKGKQLDVDDDEEQEVVSPDGQNILHYPPIAEEVLEERKVEENLKRWESVEKQRRKQARDARKPDSPSSSSSSFVEDVGRRASQLWSKTARAERDRPRAGHAVLESVDEVLPMEEPPTSREFMADNPFASPEDPATLMTAASPERLSPIPRSQSHPDRIILDAQPGQQPPPQPLGLPDPEEEAQKREQAQLEEEAAREKRWWTEWLCGCREHGGFQAGRTNPME